MKPRRKRTSAIGLGVVLAGAVVAVILWSARPRGPLAETLRGRSWSVAADGISNGKIRFAASGTCELTSATRAKQAQWSIDGDQLVISPQRNILETLDGLFGDAPSARRIELVKMTEDRIELVDRQTTEFPVKVVLTRTSE